VKTVALLLAALALGCGPPARPLDGREAAAALDRTAGRPSEATADAAAAVLAEPGLGRAQWDRAHEVLVRMAREEAELPVAALFRQLRRREIDPGSAPYVGSALLEILEANPALASDALLRAERILADRSLHPFARGTAAGLVAEIVRREPSRARETLLAALLGALSEGGAFGLYEGAGQAVVSIGLPRRDLASAAAARLLALVASEGFDETALLPILGAVIELLRAHRSLVDRAAISAVGPVLRDPRREGAVEKATELLRLALDARPDLGSEVLGDFRRSLRTRGLPARSATQATLCLGYIAADAKSPLAREALEILLEILRADPREVDPESIREAAHGFRPVARWRPGLFDRALVRTLMNLGRISGPPGMFVGSSVILRDIVQDRPDLAEVVFEEAVGLIGSSGVDPQSLPSAAGLAVMMGKREPDLLTGEFVGLLEKAGAFRALAGALEGKPALLPARALEERLRRGTPEAADYIGILRAIGTVAESRADFVPAPLLEAALGGFRVRGWEAGDYTVIAGILMGLGRSTLGGRVRAWARRALEGELDPAARSALRRIADSPECRLSGFQIVKGGMGIGQ
jgi:hypothetical protein